MRSDDSKNNAAETWWDRIKGKVSLDSVKDSLLESGYRKIRLRSLRDGKKEEHTIVKVKFDSKSKKEIDQLCKSAAQYVKTFDLKDPNQKIKPPSKIEFEVPSKSDKKGEEKFVKVELSSKYMQLDELRKLAAKMGMVEQLPPEYAHYEDAPPRYSERSSSSVLTDRPLSPQSDSNDREPTTQQQQTLQQQPALQQQQIPQQQQTPQQQLAPQQQHRKSIGHGRR